LLSAFLSLTALLPVDALIGALSHRFKGNILEANTNLIRAAAEHVEAGAWNEVMHAASA
jgi:Pyruvate/2-oxoacid:ferredoxin oxidoreductase gamma subunit